MGYYEIHKPQENRDITSNRPHLGGQPRLRGHRLSVEAVVVNIAEK